MIHEREVIQSCELALDRSENDHEERIGQRPQSRHRADRLGPKVGRAHERPRYHPLLRLLVLHGPILAVAALSGAAPRLGGGRFLFFSLAEGPPLLLLGLGLALLLAAAHARVAEARVPEDQRQLPDVGVADAVGHGPVQPQQLHEAILHEAERTERPPGIAPRRGLRKRLQHVPDDGFQLRRLPLMPFGRGCGERHSGGVPDEQKGQEPHVVRGRRGPQLARAPEES
mmetsp:Transcript_29346/g.78409  ORF Transcript_29346/g.78409 Transcript_29346/m.78409 type:complete len:228 (-) Transcript_29346:144-827(-)